METVENASNNLLLTMNQILGLIRNLIESAQKKEALVSTDRIDDLEELLEIEAQTSCSLKKKEKELKYNADNLRIAIGLPSRTEQLKEICGSVRDERCREQLSDARTEMVETIGRLNRQNAKVKELLKAKVGYAEYVLNLLHAPSGGLRSYNGQGAKQVGDDDFGLFDCHA